MTTKLLTSLLMAALFASSAFAGDNSIRISMASGKQRAEFNLNGDLSCVLADGRIRCTPMSQ